jgi:hypothetical protein
MPPGPDKRRDHRFPFQIPVRVFRGTEAVAMPTEDVSRRGVFATTPEWFQLRQLVRLQARVEPAGTWLSMHGMVVRVAAGEHGRARGMGIQFYGLGREAERAWEAFIAHVSVVSRHQTPRHVTPPEGVRVRWMAQTAGLPVDFVVRASRVEDLLLVYARDITGGHIFLETNLELPPGEPVWIHLVHPVTTATYPLAGRVRAYERWLDRSGIRVDLERRDERADAALLDFLRTDIRTVVGDLVSSPDPVAVTHAT